MKTVQCPRCGHGARFDSTNPWRPFCSERCKLIDMGHWAAESYRIPQKPGESDEALPDDPTSSTDP